MILESRNQAKIRKDSESRRRKSRVADPSLTVAYATAQVVSTPFRLVTSNQRSTKSVDFIASKFYSKVPRPFFRHHKEKRKKAVWLRETRRGAYGIVFTVKYNGIVCAAKKIHPILTDTVSPEQKQGIKDDFIKECLCCSSIRHPNIVNFLGVYYEPGPSSLPIMVMELMDTSLAKFVENNKSKISFGTKVSIVHDVSLGLSFLHNRKPPILHRDLSPNNVMLINPLLVLPNHSVAKIGDLGVAKVVRADNRQTKSKTHNNSRNPTFYAT